MGLFGRLPAQIAAVGVTYFLLARLGLLFATLNDSASPVWPASGFAIGMAIVLGPKALWGVFLGATIANFGDAAPWPCAFVVGFGNTLETAAGAFLFRLVKKGEARYGILVEAFAIFVASIVAALLSPFVGVTALAVSDTISWNDYRQVWLTWWSGDAIGSLVFTPVVLAIHFKWEQDGPRFWKTWHPLMLARLVAGMTVAAALTCFGDGTAYLCLAMLLVLAMSTGKHAVDPLVAALTVALFGIGGSAFGFGPFRVGSVNDNLLNLQLFLGSIAVSVLFLKAFAKVGPLRVPVLVMATGCVLGAFVTSYFAGRTEALDEARVDRILAENQTRIEDRIATYRNVLTSAKTLLDVLLHDDPEHAESWHRFVEGLNTRERFPGMRGIGFIQDQGEGRIALRRFAPEAIDDPLRGISIADLTRTRTLIGRDQLTLYLVEPLGTGIWVFAPVVMNEFFAATPRFEAEEMAFDVAWPKGPVNLFSSPRAKPGLLVRETPFLIEGHAFPTRWYRQKAFRSSNDTTVAWIASAISLITLALAAFVANLQAVRLRAEELARSMAKMSTLGEMAGGIAHEINNPLTVIGVTTAQLARDIETSQFDKDAMLKKVERIDRTVKRITSIVKGLRVFSRSADSVQRQVVRVQDIVNNVTDLCQDRFHHHGVELKMAGDLTVEIHVSVVQIEQVLMNLLSNAFDAVQSVPVKWVTLDVESTAREIRIVVQDSGGPIPEAVAQKMMEPFYTTKELGKGTGLGLSISKGILTSHGGQLVYDANRNHTCFVMVLPRTDVEGKAA